jgi:hypothetical protein
VSAILGNITPLIASIFPIRNALGKNLSEALDTRNSKTKAMHISMERSEDNHFSWQVLIMGVSTSFDCFWFTFCIYFASLLDSVFTTFYLWHLSVITSLWCCIYLLWSC